MRINSHYSVRPTQADCALTPIGEIQRILGHENRSTIAIYLHSIGETERDAIMRIFDREPDPLHCQTRLQYSCGPARDYHVRHQ